MNGLLRNFISRHHRLCGAVGLAFLIVAGRWALIERYGSDLPLMDQWAAETNAFLIPWGKGDPNPVHLFKPTNEHRVFFTHLVNGSLALLSGRWDARLQTATNAILYAALVAWLWDALAHRLSRTWQAGLLVLFALVGGLPLVFENALWGFQSQFMFLAGFSLLCIRLLLDAPPRSSRWWFGCVAGMCALVSMGSGVLAPAVVLVVVAARSVRDGRGFLLEQWPTIAAATALLALGWLLRTPAATEALSLHVDLGRAARYFFSGLAWPMTNRPWVAAAFFSPVTILAAIWWQRPEWRDSTATFILAGSVWMLLQTAAIAHGRSAAPLWPPPNRYGDIYLYGLLFNASALAWLVDRVQPQRRKFAQAGALVFAALFVLGAAQTTTDALATSLPRWRTDARRYESAVARYLRDGNEYALTPGSFPYTRRFEFLNILRERGVRARLPDSVITAGPSTPAVTIPRAGGLSSLTKAAVSACSAWVAVLIAGFGLTLTWLRAPRNFEV